METRGGGGRGRGGGRRGGKGGVGGRRGERGKKTQMRTSVVDILVRNLWFNWQLCMCMYSACVELSWWGQTSRRSLDSFCFKLVSSIY